MGPNVSALEGIPTAVDVPGVRKLCHYTTACEPWFLGAEVGRTGMEEFHLVE